MKIIFLDIDGVLTHYKCGNNLCQENINSLGKIIEATEAKIVITSSWRRFKFEETLAILSNTKETHEADFKFVDEIIGQTQRLFCFALEDRDHHYKLPRGCEIQRWLRENVHKFGITNYVIIDDDHDMLLEQYNHFVQTNDEIGLTDKNVDKAIRILTSKKHESTTY